jgi:hypothetical protein
MNGLILFTKGDSRAIQVKKLQQSYSSNAQASGFPASWMMGLFYLQAKGYCRAIQDRKL